MRRAILNTVMHLCFKAIWLLAVIGVEPAAATPKCPPQNELLAKAKVVVEARVKSLSIGESGLLPADTNIPTRMIRVDLEITRVIKGKYPRKEATVYGVAFPPVPFMELAKMALITGLDSGDTFEWELSRNELGPGLELYSMNNCSYYKFRDDLFSR
ncbi:hypothetical protein NXC14_CH03842 [Rhizobium sp. NXC14]|uniref:hypothetical protein n=1 Tax=Rhizobium sp. NXC14 TaxID=1981173 RepID=UPI000A203EB7|nr:hypothetical protein [Rhizobium sp. NXC14]ARO31727.1 hypothetical protein NXC14_CH03842 [Rhizobium sp. NXC14]